MVKIEISFVLRLVDDFSGKNITGSVLGFYVRGKRLNTVRKPEGHYVFTGCEKSEDILIETTHYKSRVLPYEFIENGGDAPIIIVRLYRKPGAYFLDCDWINGTGPPGKLTYALSGEVAGLSLTGFKTEDKKMRLYLGGYSTEKLIGNCYAVGDKDKRYIFYIIGRDPGGGYLISSPDLKSLQSQRSGQRITRVFSDISDINGKFTIAVDECKEDMAKNALTLEREVKEWGCYYET